jgi:hypothetical protein
MRHMRHPAEGKEFVRSLRLGQEVEIAVGLLEQGLATVQGDIGRVGSMNHLQLVFLSTGFERLLKCILSYYIRETHGRFPRAGEIRRTHDVESLLDEVLDQGEVVELPSGESYVGYVNAPPSRDVMYQAVDGSWNPLGAEGRAGFVPLPADAAVPFVLAA